MNDDPKWWEVVIYIIIILIISAFLWEIMTDLHIGEHP